MNRLKFQTGAGVWFTSDTHFDHDNIIKPDYADRPFVDVDEMNAEMIRRWNVVVGPEDTVFFIGDLLMLKDKKRIVRARAADLLKQLHGKKHLIVGNHDHTPIRTSPGWASVEWYQEITVGDQPIILSHYPMLTWNASHHGSWMLHGHCHDGLKKWTCPNCKVEMNKYARRCDVGVDAWTFAPVGMEEIALYMATIEFKPVDHHREGGR